MIPPVKDSSRTIVKNEVRSHAHSDHSIIVVHVHRPVRLNTKLRPRHETRARARPPLVVTNWTRTIVTKITPGTTTSKRPKDKRPRDDSPDSESLSKREMPASTKTAHQIAKPRTYPVWARATDEKWWACHCRTGCVEDEWERNYHGRAVRSLHQNHAVKAM